jgi:hypothetical protein
MRLQLVYELQRSSPVRWLCFLPNDLMSGSPLRATAALLSQQFSYLPTTSEAIMSKNTLVSAAKRRRLDSGQVASVSSTSAASVASTSSTKIEDLDTDDLKHKKPSSNRAAPILSDVAKHFADTLKDAGSPSERDLLQLECETLDSTWLEVLAPECV